MINSNPNRPDVKSSVFTGDSLLHLLREHFYLPETAKCIYYARGVNDTYRVDVGDKRFYLRIYRHNLRSADDIVYELSALKFLHDNQFPVAAPRMTRSSELFFPVESPEGLRYGALFLNAPGTPPGKHLSEQQATLIGMRVAEMHTLLQRFKAPVPTRYLGMHELLETPWEHLQPIMRDRPYSVLYERLRDDVMEALFKLPRRAEIQSVLAGDVHGNNLHFNSDDELTFFDFDQCGYGWRAFELAKFLSWAHSAGLPPKIRAAFMTAYQRLRPLTDQERAAIPALMQAAILWMMGGRARLTEVVPASTWSDDYFTKRLQLMESFAKTGQALS